MEMLKNFPVVAGPLQRVVGSSRARKMLKVRHTLFCLNSFLLFGCSLSFVLSHPECRSWFGSTTRQNQARG